MEISHFTDVTPDWIRQQLKKHGLTMAEFAKNFGNSQADISAYCGGKKPLSKLRKSAFYFFFKYLEEKQK